MYTLQICSAFSQEILHQKTFENIQEIESLIDLAKDWQDCYIYDDKKRALKGSYIRHSTIRDGDNTIYKVFFEVGLVRPQDTILITNS